MRILINSINFSPELTSTGKYAGEMAEWLAARGHSVRAVASPPHYPQWRLLDGYSSWRYRKEKLTLPVGSQGTLEVFRCPTWIPRVPRGFKRILYLATFSLSSWLPMLTQIFWHPDVVLLVEPTFFGCPQTLCVARLSGAVAWLHVQDLEVDVAFQLKDFSSDRLRRWVHSLEAVLLRKFDRVSSISGRMVERLSEKGVSAQQSVLFPNWVDTSAIHPLSTPSPFREELGIPKESIVALYSGNMGLKQGLDLLVDASRRLAYRSDIRWIFCGDGSYKETFVQMVGEAKNVTFLSVQPADRLNELLNLADIHLLPQRGDAADLVMPSKLTGIMASGRPVVATAGEGTQLATALTGKGISTHPGDVAAFADAVLCLADDRELRVRMGAEARKFATIHFNRHEILSCFEVSLMEASRYSRESLRSGLSKSPVADP